MELADRAEVSILFIDSVCMELTDWAEVSILFIDSEGVSGPGRSLTIPFITIFLSWVCFMGPGDSAGIAVPRSAV